MRSCEAAAIRVIPNLRELAGLLRHSNSRFSASGTVVCRARLVAEGALRSDEGCGSANVQYR